MRRNAPLSSCTLSIQLLRVVKAPSSSRSKFFSTSARTAWGGGREGGRDGRRAWGLLRKYAREGRKGRAGSTYLDAVLGEGEEEAPVTLRGLGDDLEEREGRGIGRGGGGGAERPSRPKERKKGDSEIMCCIWPLLHIPSSLPPSPPLPPSLPPLPSLLTFSNTSAVLVRTLSAASSTCWVGRSKGEAKGGKEGGEQGREGGKEGGIGGLVRGVWTKGG